MYSPFPWQPEVRKSLARVFMPRPTISLKSAFWRSARCTMTRAIVPANGVLLLFPVVPMDARRDRHFRGEVTLSQLYDRNHAVLFCQHSTNASLTKTRSAVAREE